MFLRAFFARGFFEKKPLALPKKLSNNYFLPCVPFLFYGYLVPQNRAPTPGFEPFRVSWAKNASYKNEKARNRELGPGCGE